MKMKYVKRLQRQAFWISLFWIGTKAQFPFSFNVNTDDYVNDNPVDDVDSSGSIKLPKAMSFRGRRKQAIYQNYNGVISFDEPYANFRWIGDFPAGEDLPDLIALYWTDIDVRAQGDDKNQLTVRTSFTDDDIEIATNIIRNCTGDDEDPFFTPKSATVVTYNRVNRFDRDETVENSFQIAFAYNETNTWVIMAYPELQFYSGSRSAEYAMVGFNSANNGGETEDLKYNVTSDDDMTAILKGTNCGRAGVYAYRVNYEEIPCIWTCQLVAFLNDFFASIREFFGIDR